MTKKLLKIFLIFTIILSFGITYVSASDINLNLPGTDTNQITDSNTQTNDNEINNQDVDNSDAAEQNVTTNEINNNDVTTPTDDVQTLQPSAVASSAESGLSVTNIINILLITVGVILILLAIAIIIRLK